MSTETAHTISRQTSFNTHSFHHVAVTRWKTHIEVVHTYPSGGAHPRQSGWRATVLARLPSSCDRGAPCANNYDAAARASSTKWLGFLEKL